VGLRVIGAGSLIHAIADILGGVASLTADRLHAGTWQSFETEQLMQSKAATAAVLTYVFHRLEERFAAESTGGRPTLLVLDEAWVFLSDGLFAAKIREWLKVLRKRNVAVVFATQSLSDLPSSPIAPASIASASSSASSARLITLRAYRPPPTLLSATSSTIAAIATPVGRGALATVRLSGPGVRALAHALLDPPPMAARRATHCVVRDAGGDVIDDVVATRYDAPHSFTGEDTLELSTHGGLIAPTAVLAAAIRAGLYRRVLVIGGGSLAKLGMKYEGHLRKDMPVLEDFRVGAIALAWDSDENRVVIEAQEATEEPVEPLAEDVPVDGPGVLRVRITPGAARAFAQRALRIVAAGRPPCPGTHPVAEL